MSRAVYCCRLMCTLYTLEYALGPFQHFQQHFGCRFAYQSVMLAFLVNTVPKAGRPLLAVNFRGPIK